MCFVECHSSLRWDVSKTQAIPSSSICLLVSFTTDPAHSVKTDWSVSAGAHQSNWNQLHMVENSRFALTHANQQCWETLSNSPAAQWASKEKNRGINRLGRRSFEQFMYIHWYTTVGLVAQPIRQIRIWNKRTNQTWIVWINWMRWKDVHPSAFILCFFFWFSIVQQVLTTRHQKERTCLQITLDYKMFSVSFILTPIKPAVQQWANLATQLYRLEENLAKWRQRWESAMSITRKEQGFKHLPCQCRVNHEEKGLCAKR